VLREHTTRSLRRLAVPVEFGFRRVTARPAAFVLAAAGVALAACALATVSAASLVVKDRAVGRAVAALPPDQRAVRVTWVGVSTIPADSFASLDRQVRAVTRPLGTRPPTAVLLYRDTRFGKQIVRLGAVDGLGRAVALRSGRFAQSCVPGDARWSRSARTASERRASP
jgi:hypothetical protein